MWSKSFLFQINAFYINCMRGMIQSFTLRISIEDSLIIEVKYHIIRICLVFFFALSNWRYRRTSGNLWIHKTFNGYFELSIFNIKVDVLFHVPTIYILVHWQKICRDSNDNYLKFNIGFFDYFFSKTLNLFQCRTASMLVY